MAELVRSRRGSWMMFRAGRSGEQCKIRGRAEHSKCNVAEGAYLLLSCRQYLHEVGHEESVNDEAWGVLRTHSLLLQLLPELRHLI